MDQPTAKRRKKHPTSLEAADRSSSSRSSRSSDSCSDSEIGSVDVCTIISGITEAEGLSQGWSLNLTRADAQGRVWDFDKAAFRVRCRKFG